MGVHIEAQDEEVLKQIRARETQMDNIEKLNNITEVVDNINLDGIESTTNEIRMMVTDNLEVQPNLDELLDSINKVAKGVSDIKRNQTNLNKKINDIQSSIDEITGDDNG